MQSATEANVPAAAPAAASRSKWFWVAGGLLAVLQLVAFWQLCDHQVRLADERRSEIQVRRVALAECLESIHGSTVSSCRARLAARVPETVIIPAPASADAVSVSFNLGFR